MVIKKKVDSENGKWKDRKSKTVTIIFKTLEYWYYLLFKGIYIFSQEAESQINSLRYTICSNNPLLLREKHIGKKLRDTQDHCVSGNPGTFFFP